MEEWEKDLEEILQDPLLDGTPARLDLFDIPSDMKEVMDKRKRADYVAQRKACEDFFAFQPLFEQVHRELQQGIRHLVRLSKTESIEVGQYFIIEGQLLLLERLDKKTWNQRNKRYDGRTRCIYENGTESDILLQTLRKGVMDKGYMVTEPQEITNSRFFQSADLSEKDQVTGYIYVLSSLSADAVIQKEKNLYKIGFTTGSVEERIAQAAHDPTYLMAPVKVEASYKIVNMNSHKYETLLHQVLDGAQMDVKVCDQGGKIHHPKEWFKVPLTIIDQIVQHIVNGSITRYVYNSSLQCLEQVQANRQSTFDVSGYKVLSLNIKKVYFDEILSGEKKIEYRELKQTTLNKFTYVDEADGKRYLKRYDLLRLYVGYHRNRENALVEVKNITYHDNIVEYHLGKILEHISIDTTIV